MLIDPGLFAPFINDRGMLRLKGYFPTEPERIDFEMAFETIGGQWRTFALAVYTNPATQ